MSFSPSSCLCYHILYNTRGLKSHPSAYINEDFFCKRVHEFVLLVWYLLGVLPSSQLLPIQVEPMVATITGIHFVISAGCVFLDVVNYWGCHI